MTRIKIWLVGVLALLGLSFANNTPVHAADGAQYTVSPVIPDNQRTSVSSYFDLVVKPGTTQNLTLAIVNKTGVTRHLTLDLTTAWSQPNGQIGYTPNGPKDSSAEYRLSDLGPKTQTITLPPNATKRVTTPIKIPQSGFKGVLLGGLYMYDQKKTNGGTKSGVKLKNRFATLVGVQLQTKTGAFNEIKPNLKLAGVSAGIQTGQPGVIATVQNPMPTYWGKMKWRARVYHRDSKKVIMRRTTTNYAVAPSSHLDFGILQKKALDPGDYTLDLLITGPHGRWHFKRNFSILTEQANQINKKLGLKRSFTLPWWAWLLIGLALAGLIWLIIVLWKRRRRDDDEEPTTRRGRHQHQR